MHSYPATRYIVFTFVFLFTPIVWAQVGDTDADGYDDSVDNCIDIANGIVQTNQLDADADGFGNVCDADINNDGIVGGPDVSIIFNCSNTAPGDPGPAEDPECRASDLDGNGVVSSADINLANAQLFSAPGRSGLGCAGVAPCFEISSADTDGDGFENSNDNCVLVPNEFPLFPTDPIANPQRDNDFDGIGNACDGDFDNDGIVRASDGGAIDTDEEILLACLGQFVPGNGSINPLWAPGNGQAFYNDPSCFESDMDASGVVDQKDVDLFMASLALTNPGPSGLSCAQANASVPLECGGLRVVTVEDQQQADPFYFPVLENPRYPLGTGPRVKVDNQHNNFHTISNRYLGFERMLTADGYRVEDFDARFEHGCLSDTECATAYITSLLSTDILVISNARIFTASSSHLGLISETEADLLVGWVNGSLDQFLGCPGGCTPRSLLLIADHQDGKDFPAAIENLSSRLGLNWPNNNSTGGIVYKENPDASNPFNEGFLDLDHPIAKGRGGLDEAVTQVTAYYGSVLTSNTPETAQTGVLVLNDGAEWTDHLGNALTAAGWSQAMAFSVGSGRVYASGEAAMFSAQVAVNQVVAGMHITPREQNQQYLLNMMHWLDSTLPEPDADADGIIDRLDNCTDVANPAQRDDDEDGYGNVCDWDVNQDCITGGPDISQVFSNFSATPPWNPIRVGAYDIDESNSVDSADSSAIFANLFSAPGPSGRACASCYATPPEVAGQGACP